LKNCENWVFEWIQLYIIFSKNCKNCSEKSSQSNSIPRKKMSWLVGAYIGSEWVQWSDFFVLSMHLTWLQGFENNLLLIQSLWLLACIFLTIHNFIWSKTANFYFVKLWDMGPPNQLYAKEIVVFSKFNLWLKISQNVYSQSLWKLEG